MIRGQCRWPFTFSKVFALPAGSARMTLTPSSISQHCLAPSFFSRLLNGRHLEMVVVEGVNYVKRGRIVGIGAQRETAGVCVRSVFEASNLDRRH